MLPIILDSQMPEEILKAYVGIYLKEEVQAEGVVRNIRLLSKLIILTPNCKFLLSN